MPITPFIRGDAFDPETIEIMSNAFVSACGELGLPVGDDPATRLVATKVLALVQGGLRAPEEISRLVVRDFNAEPPPLAPT
jgi:hypothetical protein